MAETLNYTGVALDRASAMRRDVAWVAERLADKTSRIVPLWRNRSLVKTGAMPEAVYLTGQAAKAVLAEAATAVLLGLEDTIAYVAADLSLLDEDAANTLAGAQGGDGTGDCAFEDLRRVGALMAGPDAALLAYAKGMIHWHQRHLYCGVCGALTASRDGGHVRVCTNPDKPHMQFPRTDPAVIMLVEHDDPEGHGPACLLGRQSRWVEGMYSTLAGFVEPGETLEEAVAREVLEESAVRVTDVRYQASQPWPFPSSLMLGFRARAETAAIRIDGRELEDARWFTPEEVRSFGEWGDAPEGEKRLPRKDSISRWLIDGWLKDRDAGD
jgi:NAD+ diphosphatase